MHVLTTYFTVAHQTNYSNLYYTMQVTSWGEETAKAGVELFDREEAATALQGVQPQHQGQEARAH